MQLFLEVGFIDYKDFQKIGWKSKKFLWKGTNPKFNIDAIIGFFFSQIFQIILHCWNYNIQSCENMPWAISCKIKFTYIARTTTH